MDHSCEYHSAAMFITLTPSGTGNATVAYFFGDISEKEPGQNLYKRIPSNAARVEIAGKDRVPCDLFLSTF